jgi:hypothetical protein
MEFVIKNRRLKLFPDGVIKCRAVMGGKETKKDIWRVVKFCKNSRGYLVASITIDGKEKIFRKHRILHLARNPSWDIFDTSINNCIDHINRSRADNSIENLRVVTQQQNTFNRSNVKGYTWDKNNNKWKAQITINGVNKYLGLFEKEDDARVAYLVGKKIYHKFDSELTRHELEEIDEYNSSF